jgi:hypothetical protein
VLGEVPLFELTVNLTPPRPIANRVASSGRATRQFAWIITRAETVSCVIAN